ncbi:MAG: 50S ribosomal protein L4, partial [Bradymonadaceae bacterium]
MSDGQNGEREHWSSALGFILAAVGSAVGLGNIWRFPYITGENGGGAFVLIYLGCVAVVGLPLLTAEMKIGRRTESAPVGAYRALARERTGGEWWKVFGFFAVATGFVLLSYYSVVGGWTLGFAWKALSGELMANPDQAFGSLTGSASQSLLYHGLFMAIAIGIVSGGVTDGIERAARNIPGVDVAPVEELNAELLAPGTEPGRLVIWSENAVEKLGAEDL